MNVRSSTRFGWLALTGTVSLLTALRPVHGQSVYFKNFVYHADGSPCRHTPPAAGYIAYLNGNRDIILTHRSPRTDGGTEPNIPGTGVFGVELANFHDPGIAEGDSVFVLFTCAETSQQGLIKAQVAQIPWYYFPAIDTLRPVPLPPAPTNVRTERGQQGTIVRWDASPGLTYDVYRRSLDDTLSDGRPRYQYRRIARRVEGNAVEDTSACDTCRFAYIVFAVGEDGALSLPSYEASAFSQIADLRLVPLSTCVLLSWHPLATALGPVLGYNIYRREEGEPVPRLVAYVGADTFYVDSRLSPNTRYWYQVTARSGPQTEIGQSLELPARTVSETGQYYRFAALRVAVVIYMNTNRGRIQDEDLGWIRRMLERARLFYWRNSGMKLNLDFHYVLIRNYREFGNPDETHLAQTVADLTERGVMNTQYDIIFRLCPAVAGYWSFGVIHLSLPGPRRETGFSHSEWPVGTGVLFPAREASGLTWIFVHEVQHAIDALYDVNGHPEMYHGDQPWNFPVACGEHFDFQAKMLRYFRDYEDLTPEWDGIWETLDVDRDGFPDDEPLVPLDERRFGSSASTPDTDGDGYTDRQEALDGTFEGSDPQNPDSDADGLPDGRDPYPRYPIPPEIPRFVPHIDGTIEPGWPLIDSAVVFSTIPDFRAKLYMACSDESLYIALDLSHYAEPVLLLDTDADGWWFSRGNLEITLHAEHGGSFDLRAWDGSEEARQYSLSRGGPGGMWDTDPAYRRHFGRRVLDPDSVRLAVWYEPPRVQFELAIPRTPWAGLDLKPGSRLRLGVRYQRLNHQPSQWATTFDLYDFAELRVAGPTGVSRLLSDRIPEQFRLLGAHPNPFVKKTVVTFEVPRSGWVEAVVYDALGREVLRTRRYVREGLQSWVWDGRDFRGTRLPSGVYFCRIAFPEAPSQVAKLLLLSGH